MTIQRIVSTEPLTDAEARSMAPARARRLATSIAGRARVLYELALGTPAFDDGGATPINPQGSLGVDRSGPPWGDAHLHPVWTYAVTINVVSNMYPGIRAIEMNGGIGHIVRLRARWWCRPFQTGPSVPYSRAYLRGLITRKGVSGTATATVRVYGPSGDSGPSTSTTGSTTSSDALGTAAWTPMLPGWNERVIEIEQTSTVGSYIGPLSLNQIARRTH